MASIFGRTRFGLIGAWQSATFRRGPAELAVFAKFPQLLNSDGKALLAAARDGDGAAAGDEVDAPETPSPTKPDAPPARATPPPPPPPSAARATGFAAEDFANPSTPVPPACAARSLDAERSMDAAIAAARLPPAALRWCGAQHTSPFWPLLRPAPASRRTRCDACVARLTPLQREVFGAAGAC